MGTGTQQADMPYDERDDDGEFKRKYTDEMVLEAVKTLKGRAGTGDIAGELGCSNRLALTRLRSLEEDGRVRPFPVGNTYLWTVANDE